LYIGDDQIAHRWRSDFFRILFPSPPREGFQKLQPVERSLTGQLYTLCERFVNDLEGYWLKAFLAVELSETSRQSLIQIYISTAEIFLQLRTQRCHVQWANPNIRPLAGEIFNDENTVIHRSQALPKGTWVGKTVSLVICPYVFLAGNENGESYTKERCVSKAKVLVSTEIEL
jgi:hypothetical protein